MSFDEVHGDLSFYSLLSHGMVAIPKNFKIQHFCVVQHSPYHPLIVLFEMLYIKALHVEGCTILSSHRKYFATITFNYKMQISL